MTDQKNYITPQGHAKLLHEFQELSQKERPELCKIIAWAASNGDRSENADYQYGKKRLREIDRRLRFLKGRLDSAVVIDPAKQKSSKVQFGASVTVLTEEGEERTVSIVGIDEVAIEKNYFSWKSPIGSALLQKTVGETVTVQTPKGESELEILKIEYRNLA